MVRPITDRREQIGAAFWRLLSRAEGFAGSSRRFIHWDQVSGTQMPFLTLLKTGEQRLREAAGTPAILFTYHVFIYISCGESAVVPETEMNERLDAVDYVVAARGSDVMQNLQTLGGVVTYCQPRGRVFVDSGDVDGKGVAAVPFEILAPWFV